MCVCGFVFWVVFFCLFFTFFCELKTLQLLMWYKRKVVTILESYVHQPKYFNSKLFFDMDNCLLGVVIVLSLGTLV